MSTEMVFVAFRATPRYREWLAQAEHLSRMGASDLLDHAVAELAQRKGWPPPPPRLKTRADRMRDRQPA